jgi:hypothetical protein
MMDFTEMGLFGADSQIEPVTKELRGEENEDMWVVHNALKIDRIKHNIDKDKDKGKRTKSAGELALRFMGFNQKNYDLMLENPMTGYMNEVIFTRVLGHQDIYQGNHWVDCSQCWVCEKWNKTQITYNADDRVLMKKHIQKLGDLDQIIRKYVDVSNKKQHHTIPITKMFDHDGEGEKSVFPDIGSMKRLEEKRAKTTRPTKRPVDDPDYESIETATEERIFTDSQISN